MGKYLTYLSAVAARVPCPALPCPALLLPLARSLPTYLPTYLPAYLPTYLPTCLPAYLPTYLPAYLHESISTSLDPHPLTYSALAADLVPEKKPPNPRIRQALASFLQE